MPHSKTRRKKSPKRILALPDLDHAKAAVLNSLSSAGLLSPELAAGIRRVKGVRRIGVRLGKLVDAGTGATAAR
jgi:hypothetical protein